MKSNPENPPKITKNPSSTELLKNHQQNTKKSLTKYQQSPKINNKNPKSPRRRSCFAGEDVCLSET
jgi:hypothetical protein